MIKNPIYIKDKNEEYENNFTMFFNDMKKNLKKLNEYTNDQNRKVVERDLSSINNNIVKSNVFLNELRNSVKYISENNKGLDEQIIDARENNIRYKIKLKNLKQSENASIQMKEDKENIYKIMFLYGTLMLLGTISLLLEFYKIGQYSSNDLSTTKYYIILFLIVGFFLIFYLVKIYRTYLYNDFKPR